MKTSFTTGSSHEDQFYYRIVTRTSFTTGSCHHDDAIKWKHFPRYWPFVRGIHRSPVDSPHNGQWRGALMFIICAWTSGLANNRYAGNLRHHRAHYVVLVIWRPALLKDRHIKISLTTGASHENQIYYRIVTGSSWRTQTPKTVPSPTVQANRGLMPFKTPKAPHRWSFVRQNDRWLVD